MNVLYEYYEYHEYSYELRLKTIFFTKPCQGKFYSVASYLDYYVHLYDISTDASKSPFPKLFNKIENTFINVIIL